MSGCLGVRFFLSGVYFLVKYLSGCCLLLDTFCSWHPDNFFAIFFANLLQIFLHFYYVVVAAVAVVAVIAVALLLLLDTCNFYLFLFFIGKKLFFKPWGLSVDYRIEKVQIYENKIQNLGRVPWLVSSCYMYSIRACLFFSINYAMRPNPKKPKRRNLNFALLTLPFKKSKGRLSYKWKINYFLQVK